MFVVFRDVQQNNSSAMLCRPPSTMTDTPAGHTGQRLRCDLKLISVVERYTSAPSCSSSSKTGSPDGTNPRTPLISPAGLTSVASRLPSATRPLRPLFAEAVWVRVRITVRETVLVCRRVTVRRHMSRRVTGLLVGAQLPMAKGFPVNAQSPKQPAKGSLKGTHQQSVSLYEQPTQLQIESASGQLSFCQP